MAPIAIFEQALGTQGTEYRLVSHLVFSDILPSKAINNHVFYTVRLLIRFGF
jgi:hypothetical protein